MKARISLFLCAILAVGARAEVRSDEALFVDLNGEGLEILASEVSNTHLKDVSNEALPNYEDTVSGGVKIKAQGMRYSVDFGGLTMTPRADHLDVALEIKRVHVTVDKARFTKKILVDISSTCKNTTVAVEGGTVRGRLHLKVADKSLDLSSTTLSFPIAKQAYKVHGPSECSGFLVGGLIKYFVHKTLSKSKNIIEKKLNEKMKDMIPVFGEQLNALVKRDISVEVPKLFALRSNSITLSTWPHYVSLAQQGMAFTLGVGVQRGDKRTFEFGLPERAGEVGEAGVNPELLNEVMAALLKRMPEWTEISDAQAPGLSEVLTVENLASIWPDLKTLSLSSPGVRAFVGFSAPPEFKLSAREARLKTIIPLKVQFHVEKAGQWVPYFELTLRADVTAILDIQQQHLLVNLDSDLLVTVGGSWSGNYTPADPNFETEVAEVIFASLFEYLYASGPIARVKIPPFEVGGAALQLDSPYVLKPFLRVKLSR